MNILLKAFDGPYCKIISEAALKGVPLGTVLSVLEDKEQFPDLDAKEHTYICARQRRVGDFSDVDWNTITPLDEPLIEQMREYEAAFLSMVGRYAFKGTFTKELSYDERRKQYFDNLRYWNHMLDEKKIELFLGNHIPHQGYDYVIYGLCKVKGIPMLMFDRFAEIDTCFVAEDWEEPAKELEEELKKLQEEYSDPKKDIPLSEQFEEYYQLQKREESPWYLKRNRKKYLLHTNFFMRWKRIVLGLLRHHPIKLLRLLSSPSEWKKKLRQHAILRYYDRHAIYPDLSKPYIYVPLHMQPEASTNPRAGAYMDQQFIVELLAWHLPPEVSLYVKEHPNQAEYMRSKEYYKHLMDIPSVTLVSKKCNTFHLIKNAVAIGTAAGSAGVEGLFQEKPVLMFGHRLYQYATGIHLITSSDDCKNAIEEIVAGRGKPTRRDFRLLMRAMQNCGARTVPSTKKPPHPQYSFEERAQILGEYLASELHKRYPEHSKE